MVSKEQINKIKETLLNPRVSLLLCMIPLIFLGLYLTFREADNKIIDEDTLKNTTEIQEVLEVNRPNAEALRTEIITVEKPIYVTQVEATSKEDAMEKVQETYDKKEFPSFIYNNPDRTLITSKNKYEVGVYNVNLYRNWEIGTGVGVHDKDFYIPLSITRNYSRSHSVTAEVHYDPSDSDIDGYEIKYNIHF